MERISFINPSRINWCCAENGITLDQLAKETSIPIKALEQVESGEQGLTFNQLSKIADYFGRGAIFFLEGGDVDEQAIHTPEFRTIANQKPEISIGLKKLIERTERQRSFYLGLIEDIDSEESGKYEPPQVSKNDIKLASIKARKWLGLSDQNSFEEYRSAIEKNGILVFRSNGYKGSWQIPKESKILGFNLYDKNNPLIFVRKQFSEPHQTFTLMHELGHILLHKNSSIDDESDFRKKDGQESEANKFAGMVLVPDSFLALINDEDRPLEVDFYEVWLREFSRKWGVSTEVILRRLLDEGRLSKDKYREYRAWRKKQVPKESMSGTRQYRHREPKNIFGENYVRAVLQSLQNGKLSLYKASKSLDGISVKNLRQLESHITGREQYIVRG